MIRRWRNNRWRLRTMACRSCYRRGWWRLRHPGVHLAALNPGIHLWTNDPTRPVP